MDPLTIFVASIVGGLISDALEAPDDFEDHYRRDLEIYRGWVPMQAHNVIWWVEPGEAVWIEAKYLRPISGNIFSSEKLGAVASSVRNATEPVAFYAPYGQIKKLDYDDIAESIQYADDEVGPAYTTGDDDLDAWLADPETFLEENDWRTQEEMEAELVEAIAANDGDLGAWTASVRDGNHRAFGSILGGEEWVAIRIYDCDVSSLQDRALSNRLRPQDRALLEKMVEDSGGEPAHWMTRSSFKEALSFLD